MNRSGYASDNGLFWLLGDHLGSTSITANSDGTFKSELRYKAWGEVRYASGTTPTTFRYTGQRQEQSLGGTDGLYYYGARFYDPYLGRFIQPDAIVPSTGEGNNPNAIGYMANANYSPLVGDYHESQFLVQLNQENWQRLQNPHGKFPPVPTNSLAAVVGFHLGGQHKA